MRIKLYEEGKFLTKFYSNPVSVHDFIQIADKRYIVSSVTHVVNTDAIVDTLEVDVVDVSLDKYSSPNKGN